MKTKSKTKIPVERELLKELYVNQRLSTIQVAEKLSQRHGIKVSFEWVNRWLENLGIPRRTQTEAQRLDLPLTTEQLEYLYRIQMLSAKEIAKLIGCSKQSILRRLRWAGILIRSSEEVGKLAQIYPRKSFDGDIGERLYYQGYHTGDLYRLRLSKFSIYITLSTTVPASIELFRELFSKYGEVKIYSQRDYLTGGYEWHLRVYLERPSFDFLIDKVKRLPEEAKGENFYKFLAGYSDAEGAIYVTHAIDERTGKDNIRYRFKINSQDKELLEDIQQALLNDGFHPLLELKEKEGYTRDYNNIDVNTNKDIYELSMNRNEEVIQLLLRIPVRHDCKKRQKQMLLRIWYEGFQDYRQVALQVEELRKNIENDISNCTKRAKLHYEQHHKSSKRTFTHPLLFPNPSTLYVSSHKLVE